MSLIMIIVTTALVNNVVLSQFLGICSFLGVSSQKKAISMLEALAWVTFHVTEDDITIDREHTGALPLVCQYTAGPVRFQNVYLLEDYTEDLAASHGIRNYGGVTLRLEDLQKWSTETLGDFVLTKDQILHNSK